MSKNAKKRMVLKCGGLTKLELIQSILDGEADAYVLHRASIAEIEDPARSRFGRLKQGSRHLRTAQALQRQQDRLKQLRSMTKAELMRFEADRSRGSLAERYGTPEFMDRPTLAQERPISIGHDEILKMARRHAKQLAKQEIPVRKAVKRKEKIRHVVTGPLDYVRQVREQVAKFAVKK